MTTARVGPGEPRAAAVAGVVLFGTLGLTFAALPIMGAKALLLPAVLAFVLASVRWPALPVSMLVVGSVLLEQEISGAETRFAPFYEGVVGNLTPFELLTYLSVAVVALDCVRRRRLPPLPASIAGALIVLAVAILCGSIVGYDAVGLKAQIDGVRNTLVLIVMAPLVAAVLPPERLKLALGVGAVLIGFKAVLALLLTAQAGGASIGSIVYYAIPANWLFMLYTLVMIACRVRGAKLPAWAWALAPLAFLGFVVGLKRALWLGAIVGILFILVVGLSRLGRRLAIPTAVIAVALVYLLVTTTVSGELQGPVAERVTSLQPGKVATNTQDRYRLDERANVWIGIKEQPLLGLGQGVKWGASVPLGIEHGTARDYVHFAILWFWMKYTIVGVFGYLLLLGSAIGIGLRAFRRHPDRLISAVSLGFAATFVSLAVAEVTVTFTGADARFTAILGAVIGMLAVMDRQAKELRAGATPRGPDPAAGA